MLTERFLCKIGFESVNETSEFNTQPNKGNISYQILRIKRASEKAV